MKRIRKRWCFTVVICLLSVDFIPAATLYVSPDSTNATPPYANWSTAATTIQPAVDAANDGDEILVTNGVYETGGELAPGTLTNRVVIAKNVIVRSVNGPKLTVIGGYNINGNNAVRCVYMSLGTLSGFTLTNGATGLSTFNNNPTNQNCGGGVFCTSTNAVVTNCFIAGNFCSWEGAGAYGGTIVNCTLNGNITSNDHGAGAGFCVLTNCILSQNSAGWNGGGAWHCILYNCTVTNNSANQGGGAWESTLYDCQISGNSAGDAGGAFGSTLYNCVLSGNSAGLGGGISGMSWAPSSLYNCTLTGNSASGYGGGADCDDQSVSITLNNCVLYSNISARSANYDDTRVALNYCCTTPLPSQGIGNITNAPLFVDYTNGDFHLQSKSPCINAGNNAYVTTATDIDGNPRIVSGTVDIGAYEYQGLGSVISYAWLQQYALRTDGSADFIDSDGDGMNNWQEWVCGTCPTNAQSALRMLSAQPAGTNVTVSWESVAGVNYFLERVTSLNSPFGILATDVVGQSNVTSYTDTNSIADGHFYYRVSVPH